MSAKLEQNLICFVDFKVKSQDMYQLKHVQLVKTEKQFENKHNILVP